MGPSRATLSEFIDGDLRDKDRVGCEGGNRFNQGQAESWKRHNIRAVLACDRAAKNLPLGRGQREKSAVLDPIGGMTLLVTMIYRPQSARTVQSTSILGELECKHDWLDAPRRPRSSHPWPLPSGPSLTLRGPMSREKPKCVSLVEVGRP